VSPARAWQARRARLEKATGRDSVRFARRRLGNAATAVEEECLLMSRTARDLDQLEELVLRIARGDLPEER
jgi:hypothetical protein